MCLLHPSKLINTGFRFTCCVDQVKRAVSTPTYNKLFHLDYWHDVDMGTQFIYFFGVENLFFRLISDCLERIIFISWGNIDFFNFVSPWVHRNAILELTDVWAEFLHFMRAYWIVDTHFADFAIAQVVYWELIFLCFVFLRKDKLLVVNFKQLFKIRPFLFVMFEHHFNYSGQLLALSPIEDVIWDSLEMISLFMLYFSGNKLI